MDEFKIALSLVTIGWQAICIYYAVKAYKRIKRIEEKQNQFDEQQKVIIETLLDCQDLLIQKCQSASDEIKSSIES